MAEKDRTMGEAKLNRSGTQKLIAEYPDCCFCGGLRHATTREHMPPKALFDGGHRPDKLIMPACEDCNHGTKTADLTASILSRWHLELSAQQRADHQRLTRGLRNNNPELITEWINLRLLDRLKAKRDMKELGVPVPANAGVVAIGPLTIRQLNLFSHKVVLALYFEHFRKPLPNTGRVCAFWRTKEDLFHGGIPPVLLEMLKRYGTLEQGQWNEKEVFDYRYEPNENEGLFACLARLRGALFIAGFAVEDAKAIVEDDGPDWIVPSNLLQMLNDPLFEKRH
jgi:hypothetical protein